MSEISRDALAFASDLNNSLERAITLSSGEVQFSVFDISTNVVRSIEGFLC